MRSVENIPTDSELAYRDTEAANEILRIAREKQLNYRVEPG